MINVPKQFCTRERPIDQESVMTSGKWLPCATTIRIWFNWSYYGPTLGQLDSKRMLSDMQRIVDIARQTTNSNYDSDVVSLAKRFEFTGICSFEYSPDEPIGSVQTIQPIVTYVQQLA